MIEISNVKKMFQTSTALYPLSLHLSHSQTHVLLGSSGSGKSTLLRIILGLLAPEEGGVRIKGEEVRNMSPGHRAKYFGYVPQDGGLFPHLSVYQNTTLVARSLGWSLEQCELRYKELNMIVRLDSDLIHRFPSQLSGGQKQRVALFRSLFLDPDIILLDEPFSALDPLTRSDIQQDVKELFAGLNKTIILVTHDVGEAFYLGNNIILMDQGRVIQEGPFKNFITHPVSDFVKRFFNAQRSWHD